MSTSLSELSSFVEGLLWIRKAYKSNFPQTDPAPVMARLIYSGPQKNGPLDCWGEVVVAYIPDVGGEGGLRPFGIVELLD